MLPPLLDWEFLDIDPNIDYNLYKYRVCLFQAVHDKHWYVLKKTLHYDQDQELIVLWKLQGPGIIKLYGYIWDDNETKEELWMVMDYHSVSVLNFVADTCCSLLPDIRVIQRLMRQLLSTVHTIHTQHKMGGLDIKPENLLMDHKKQHLYMIDVGDAKPLGQFGLDTYTRSFLPPEAFANSDWTVVFPRSDIFVDENIDVYAIGITFYELLFAETAVKRPYTDIPTLQHRWTKKFGANAHDPRLHMLQEAFSLLLRLTNPLKRDRITIAEALNHPFLVDIDEKISTPNEPKVAVQTICRVGGN